MTYQYEIDQNPDRIRGRIRGANGPDRKQLPCFALLGTLDFFALRRLQSDVRDLLQERGKEHNDLNNPDLYQVTKGVERIFAYFPDDYKQHLFQVTGDGAPDIPEEWEFDKYLPEVQNFERFVKPYVDPHFRARLAIVRPGDVIDWHIDSNTSYACRGMLVVHGKQQFMVKKRNKVYTQEMVPGEIWFCNTGFAHRVETEADETRVSILFSFHHDAAKDRIPCVS